MAVKAIEYYGTGLNDAISGGTYSGSIDAVYTIEMLSNGAPDVFRWKKDSGVWTSRAISCTAQTLSDGVTVTFADATGHTIGDRWTISATATGAEGWDQAGKDYRKSCIVPKALELNGSAKYATTYDGYCGVYSDLILHQKHIGEYDVIEGDHIATKELYHDYIYFVTKRRSDGAYCILCIDPEDEGAIVWDALIDVQPYIGSATSINVYGIPYFFLYSVDNELRLMLPVTTTRNDDQDAIYGAQWDINGHLIVHYHHNVSYSTNQDTISVVGIRYSLEGAVIAGIRQAIETSIDGVDGGTCAVVFDSDLGTKLPCGQPIILNGIFSINGHTLCSPSTTFYSSVAKSNDGYLNIWMKWGYGGLYTHVLYQTKYTGTAIIVLAHRGSDYVLSTSEQLSCTEALHIRSKGAIDSALAGWAAEDAAWAEQWAIGSVDTGYFHSCTAKNSTSSLESILVSYADNTIASYAPDGNGRKSITKDYKSVPIFYEKADDYLPNVSYLTVIGVGQGKIFSDGLPAFGPAVTWEQSDAYITHTALRFFCPIFDSKNLYINTSAGLVGYDAAGTFLFRYAPAGFAAFTIASSNAHPCCSDQTYYLPLRDGSCSPSIHALTNGFGAFTVQHTLPLNNAVNVHPGAEITIDFSSQPKADTITADSVRLLDYQGNAVSYSVVSSAGRMLVLKPTAAMESGRRFVVSCLSALKNVADNPLSPEYSFAFFVGDGMTVKSTDPADNATAISTELATITAVFDRALEVATATTTTVKVGVLIKRTTIVTDGIVTSDTASIAGGMVYTVSATGDTVTVTIPGVLADNTVYAVVLTTGVLGADQKSLYQDYIFTFTTTEHAVQDFPPEPDPIPDPEDPTYTMDEVRIEGPDSAYSECTELLIRCPNITSSDPAKHPPRWRLHFKIDSYADEAHTTPIDSLNSQENPECFGYSSDNGTTWRNFPADGLPPQQYGSLVMCVARTGRGIVSYLVPSVGAEPA